MNALENKRSSRHPTADEEPSSLDDLVSRLKHDSIKDLNLAWRSSDFLHSRRCATLLKRALRRNKSVQSVSIGWRKGDRDSWLKVLGSIGEDCAYQLKSLQLVLDDWLPETMLDTMLQQQTALETLDLRSIRVLRKNALGERCCGSHWRRYDESPPCDHNIVSRIIVRLRQHPALTTLCLDDCDVDDRTAPMLSQWLQDRGGIPNLSLRNNRKLGHHGLSVICQANITQSLDLSLCDFDGKAAQAVAKAIAMRTRVLGKLLLCGNYQIDIQGLQALTSPACCSKLTSLDISYCDYTDIKAVAIISSLLKLGNTATLQQIIMQGACLSSDDCAKALFGLLKSDSPMRVIRMNGRQGGDRHYLKITQLQDIVEALENNYQLEHLDVESCGASTTGQERALRKMLAFYLNLNRAGRKILLRKEQSKSDPDWFDVLAAIPRDECDTMYWMVRQSADRF